MEDVKIIFTLTSEFHDDVTEIYEEASDGNDIEAVKKIDDLVAKLKHLKNNLTKKDEV